MPDRWLLGTRNPFTVYRVADGAHDVEHARDHFVCAFRREEDARLAVDAVNAQAVHDGDTCQSADSDLESAQGELNEARLWLARRGVEVKTHRSLTWALNGAERAGVVGRPATDPAGSAVGQRGAPTPRPDRGEVARIIEDAWASNYESAMHGGGTASPEDLAWEAAGDILDLLPTPGGPRRDCENCDGRGCMDCVSRTMHDQCRDDCPTCCAPRDGGLAGVAPFDLARLATALGVSLDPDDPDPVGRLVEAAGKAREVEVVSGAEAATLPRGSRYVACDDSGIPLGGATVLFVGSVEEELSALTDYVVLDRRPAPAPAALAVGEVVESAADLDRRASVGTIVEDAREQLGKRMEDIPLEHSDEPGRWVSNADWGTTANDVLAFPVTVVRVGTGGGET